MTKQRVFGILLFLVAFCFYLHGTYPSVSAGDSGEFIAASHILGIPHPPGFPVYVLLAKCAEAVLPWANVGYRINLLSVLCGSLSVAVLFFVTIQAGLSVELAVCAAVLFMLGQAQRVNAQASEVFALHTLVCGAVLWAALSNQWLLSAFLLGIGLGNHQTILFLAPGVAIAYIARPPNERVSPYKLVLCLAGGLTTYAYLYIRAAKSPMLNAGDPQTLERLWRVFTRADYGSMTLALGDSPVRNVETTGQQIMRFLRGLSDQVTWVGLLVGGVGILGGLRRRFLPTLTITLSFCFLGPFFFLLGNLPFDAQSTGLLERFYIVPAFMWILLMMLGFDFVTERQRFLRVAAFVFPLFLAVQQVRAFPFRADVRAYAYGRNNLRTLPQRSLFLMDGGDDTFYTLAYLTQVENRRLDVDLHDRGGVVFPGFYGPDFRRLSRTEKEVRRLQVERAVLANGRSVLYSTMNEQIVPDVRCVQEGILYRADAGKSPARNLWPLYDLRGAAPWTAVSQLASIDFRTRSLVPFYAFQRSVQVARDAKWEDAMGFASAAQAAGPDVVWLIPNLVHNAYNWAQANFQAGRSDQAAQIYRSILSWDPNQSAAWSNLGAIEEKNNHLDAAVAAYQKAIEIDPSFESAHFNLAVAFWKMENWPKVVEELTRTLSLNPANAAARKFLDQAKARNAGLHP